MLDRTKRTLSKHALPTLGTAFVFTLAFSPAASATSETACELALVDSETDDRGHLEDVNITGGTELSTEDGSLAIVSVEHDEEGEVRGFTYTVDGLTVDEVYVKSGQTESYQVGTTISSTSPHAISHVVFCLDASEADPDAEDGATASEDEADSTEDDTDGRTDDDTDSTEDDTDGDADGDPDGDTGDDGASSAEDDAASAGDEAGSQDEPADGEHPDDGGEPSSPDAESDEPASADDGSDSDEDADVESGAATATDDATDVDVIPAPQPEPEVLGIQLENPMDQEQPSTSGQDVTEVANAPVDVAAEDELPRTGVGTMTLAGLGLGLVGAGGRILRRNA